MLDMRVYPWSEVLTGFDTEKRLFPPSRRSTLFSEASVRDECVTSGRFERLDEARSIETLARAAIGILFSFISKITS